MSEQDRVDSPEHDDVEAHKHHMTDDADSWEDVEAHGGTGRNPQATQEPGSDDTDDVEAHGGTGRNPQATQEPGSDDTDDVEAHGGTGRNPQKPSPL
jgi:hypothetical protein